MGYLIPVFKELISSYRAEITLIHWDKKKNTSYQLPEIKNLSSYNISSFDKDNLDKFIIGLDPEIILISGWQEKRYLPIAKKMKNKGKIIITLFDDIWKGNLRQIFGAFVISKFLKSKFFSHAMVAGPYQFEYAKKFGFKNEDIRFNALSCDTKNYTKKWNNIKKLKFDNYPKRFLYVGRFEFEKGTDILIEAYRIYKKRYKGHWKLTCIGEGSLFDMLNNEKNIEILPFSSQSVLLKYANESGAFILPSRTEQWGVVVQEFSCAGLPLILSDTIGSIPNFMTNGLNGFVFKNKSSEELAYKMNKISNLSNDELIKMGERNNQLGKKITPLDTAASIISCYEGK